MIFLTVGGQLPFDRMVRLVDGLAPGLDEPVFAQIGASDLVPSHIEAVKFLGPQEFHQKFAQARLVVGHAGIGTILTAIELRKPVALMPRRASFGEHRNDHQLATVEQLSHIPGVYIFEDEASLTELVKRNDLTAAGEHVSESKSSLIEFLKNEVARAAAG